MPEQSQSTNDEPGSPAGVARDAAIAAILEAAGAISPEVMAQARELQAERGGPLADTLLRLELDGRMAISEGEFLRVFAAASKTRFVRSEKLAAVVVEDAILEQLPARAAERLGIVPLRFGPPGELHVVAAVPVDPSLRAELELLASATVVHLYVATPAAVGAAIRRLYYRDPDASGLLSQNGAGPLPEPKVVARPAEKKRAGTQTRLVYRDDQEALAALRQENARYRIAQEFHTRVPLDRDGGRLLENILAVIFDLLPADAAAILTGDRVRSRTREQGAHFEVPLSILTRTLDEPEGLLINDLGVDARFDGAQSVVARGVRSAMAVQLRSRGKVHGVLYLDSVSSPFAFGRDDLGLLQAFASQAALLLENSHLLEEVQREGEHRATLSRFLSPALVEQAISGTLELRPEGHASQATVLFADIRGFTAMTSHLPAQEVVRVLNEFFGGMTEVVFQHGGAIDKFIGDCVMASWGLPLPRPDDGARALAAAVAMVKRAQTVTAAGRPLEVGIGVNTGPVVLGCIGSARRLDYTSIGVGVNLASRLCSLARPGEVLTTAATLAVAGGRVQATARPAQKVKGFDEPVVPYLVTAAEAGSSG